jgi:hypothetical protein
MELLKADLSRKKKEYPCIKISPRRRRYPWLPCISSSTISADLKVYLLIFTHHTHRKMKECEEGKEVHMISAARAIYTYY